MERYAREDTHYLLYIYHRTRNELIRRSTKDVNLLAQVRRVFYYPNIYGSFVGVRKWKKRLFKDILESAETEVNR